jgi:hypothetical protein
VPRTAVIPGQCLEPAEPEREVASADSPREQLCPGKPRLLADPELLHELRLRDEGDAEEEATE